MCACPPGRTVKFNYMYCKNKILFHTSGIFLNTYIQINAKIIYILGKIIPSQKSYAI